MLEKTISEIITRHCGDVWPDLALSFVERERRLAGGNIIDLRFRDATGDHWIIELKRDTITKSAVLQLAGYLDELSTAEPTTKFRGMAVAPIISTAGRTEAEARGILCREIDENELRAIGERHGLAMDHDSGHRPKRSGTAAVRSRPKPTSGTRPATDPADVAFLQDLDAAFPPGSLNSQTPIETLESYWATSTPKAPIESRIRAARLTQEVLRLLPNAAVSNRSPGKSDSYTTIRSLDGRVAAAIDARARYTKLDFPLPTEVAETYRTAGNLRIWKPRGYGVWCQSRVGDKLPIDLALTLLRLGIAYEFKDHGVTAPNDPAQ